MTGEGGDPWSLRADGLALTVRLTPKSSRDGIDGIEHQSDGRPYLRARVRAVPDSGKANEALVALLAKSLKTPAASVRLASGATGRLKVLNIVGDGPELASRCKALVEALARPKV